MTTNRNANRVLIIDDEESIREGSKRILSRMDYEVVTAGRGEEGLETLSRDQAAIVLLDMKMPGMDGMEVLQKIRETHEDVLVIVITGYATVETAIQAMKTGAYDFIPKPFEPDQLRIVVSRARERLSLTLEAEKAEKARMRTLIDLDTEKNRISTIMESLPNGVLVTNTKGQVVLMNPACREHLGIEKNRPLEDPLEACIPDEDLCRLVMEISRGEHLDFDDIPAMEFTGPRENHLIARARPVLGERRECLGAVVNLADVTAIKVLDQLKSEFVAKVSHELRSPLSTIHEQLALVMEDMVGQLSQNDAHLLSRAKEKTQGLISLIGDLLDLSRIESGTVSHEPKPIHLEALMGSIIDFLNTRAQTKNQILSLNLPSAPLPPLTADPLALESIFGNLIANAINYTQEGGGIDVNLDLTGINIRITVTDNGFGMETKHLDKIFEKFYRVKTDKTRHITGTGLGLPIVKGLVDSLNGIIAVESEPGRGTTFTVLLPVAMETTA
ncbi:MAG: response regulator [Deltaproteobacteria bacterium]|nr:response regulator [Deltaproteobacteria bacterium]